MRGGLGGRGRFDESNRPALSVDAFVARRLLAGWKPAAVVAASGGALSVRTAYRWKHDLMAIEDVTVDGWTATFARRRRKPPIRISPWVRA